jgi:hypothetical protein
VIPLNQLIPECLLALGGAFLLGNLAAYIRLRPAWRDAKRARSGRMDKQDTRTVTNGRVNPSTGGKAGAASAGATDARQGGPGRNAGATRAGTARTVGAESGVSRTRVTKAVDPKTSGSKAAGGKRKAPATAGSKLPSRTRVLANVVIGLLITVAALATLIRG